MRHRLRANVDVLPTMVDGLTGVQEACHSRRDCVDYRRSVRAAERHANCRHSRDRPNTIEANKPTLVAVTVRIQDPAFDCYGVDLFVSTHMAQYYQKPR